MDKVSFGKKNLVSKLTHGHHHWSEARKGVAPSFSNTNLMLRLEQMNGAVYSFMSQLEQLGKSKIPIDISSLMIHFTIDFLTITMFNESFDCCAHFDKPFTTTDIDGLSEGKKFLNVLNIAAK